MFSNFMGHLIHIFDLFNLDEILGCYIMLFRLSLEMVEDTSNGIVILIKKFLD